MSRLEERLAAADPAAGLQPDPYELRERMAALTGPRPPRRPLAVRLAPVLALAGLAAVAVVVALGAPKDERESAAPAEPGVVHMRLQVDWPHGGAQEEVWQALDGSSERRLMRLPDGTEARPALLLRRDGRTRLLRARPEVRLLQLLTDVDGNLLRGRLRELGRTTVEGLPVIQVAAARSRVPSAFVDAHFRRPLWLVRGDEGRRRERVLDWNVLADTPANRALTVPG
jgi:hypothetical protein